MAVIAGEKSTSEEILEWSGAEVDFCDEFVDGDGKSIKISGAEHWGFSWEAGGIGFISLSKKSDWKRARVAAAMFVYLWTRGVEASVANKLAESYVTMWSVG